MIEIYAVIEERDDDWLAWRLLAPGERACDVVEPPLVAVAIAAIVGRYVIDRRRGHQRRADERLTGKPAQFSTMIVPSVVS